LIPPLEEEVLSAMLSETLKNLQQKMRVEEESNSFQKVQHALLLMVIFQRR
jgi:hypothetical protein